MSNDGLQCGGQMLPVCLLSVICPPVYVHSNHVSHFQQTETENQNEAVLAAANNDRHMHTTTNSLVVEADVHTRQGK